jgi:hypothetical protein
MDTLTQKAMYNYSDKTKNICSILTIILMLIIVFIISPFQLTGVKSGLLKLLIVSILGYTLYINFSAIKDLANINGLFTKSNLSTIRNNVILSCIFSAFILLLALYVLITLFN